MNQRLSNGLFAGLDDQLALARILGQHACGCRLCERGKELVTAVTALAEAQKAFSAADQARAMAMQAPHK